MVLPIFFDLYIRKKNAVNLEFSTNARLPLFPTSDVPTGGEDGF